MQHHHPSSPHQSTQTAPAPSTPPPQTLFHSSPKQHLSSLHQPNSMYHATLSLIDPTTIALTPFRAPPILSSPLGQFKRFKRAAGKVSLPPMPTQLSSSLLGHSLATPASSISSLPLNSSTALSPIPPPQLDPLSLGLTFPQILRSRFNPKEIVSPGSSFTFKSEPPSIQLSPVATLKPTSDTNNSWHEGKDETESNILLLDALLQGAQAKAGLKNLRIEGLSDQSSVKEHGVSGCSKKKDLLGKIIRRERLLSEISKTGILLAESSRKEGLLSGSLKTVDLSDENLRRGGLISRRSNTEDLVGKSSKTEDLLCESLRKEGLSIKSSKTKDLLGERLSAENLLKKGSKTKDLLGKISKKEDAFNDISKTGILLIESSRKDSLLSKLAKREASLDKSSKRDGLLSQSSKTDEFLLGESSKRKDLLGESSRREGSPSKNSEREGCLRVNLLGENLSRESLLASQEQKPVLYAFNPVFSQSTTTTLLKSGGRSDQSSSIQSSTGEFLGESLRREGSMSKSLKKEGLWDQNLRGGLLSESSRREGLFASQEQKPMSDGFVSVFGQSTMAPLLKSGGRSGELCSVQSSAGENAKEKSEDNQLNTMPEELSSLLEFFPTTIQIPEWYSNGHEISSRSFSDEPDMTELEMLPTPCLPAITTTDHTLAPPLGTTSPRFANSAPIC